MKSCDPDSAPPLADLGEQKIRPIRCRCQRWYHMFMVQKTTVYLPDDLKSAIEREARRRGCSEATVIREAVASALDRPRPRVGLLDAEPIAESVDELLAGFGER